ncbi:MAG: hypothetical protein HOM34_07000 [Planctomycetes bacterium]|jgi:soluble cytochrome b562|nr:hypothetical protein [Planctomycetota bacterium]MBT4029184.1 hypothetical protein [Planctomycetota bacterium]MBT4559265.1 hypothetical protein [Planctomycetota bacterium]MBT5101983.1 hypothetical protein [Planctomycetota bacterium]MBT5120451.1 hypothetical protein [Planctomycetota bacterium]
MKLATKLTTLALILLMSWGMLSTSADAVTLEETPLEKAMDKLKDGMKSLKGVLGDATKTDKAMSILQSMEVAAMDSYRFTPDAPAELKGNDLRAYNTGFRKGMLAIAMTVVDMELAVLDGRNADAKKGYQQLSRVKKGGHKKYKPEDEDEHGEH